MFTDLALLIMLIGASPAKMGVSGVELASHSISLEQRYSNSYVNNVFKDNILLTLKYLSGSVKSKSDIRWDEVEKPFQYEFSLEPKGQFVFHDQVLPKYKYNVVKTTNAHFSYTDGFKSDGYLTGDGVCHLASIIYWVSKEAGLDAIAPTNHNFAVIPEVPKGYGVSILSSDPNQNLYITNNFEKTVKFVFNYDGTNLKVSINVIE